MRTQPHEKGPAPVDAGTGPKNPSQWLKTDPENSNSGVLAQALSLPIPNEQTVRWLMGHGVGDAAMLRPWLIKSAKVRFLGPRVFEFEPSGAPALIFQATDRGECFDLIAWQASAGRLASWRGAAFCLGDADACFNPGTWALGEKLRVHLTPLDWLLAERDGIVRVRPALTHAHLRYCPRLIVADQAHARRIRRALEPPRPYVEIFVDDPTEREAA